jgi:peroxiredoxin
MFNLIYAVPEYLKKNYLDFGNDTEQYNGQGNLQFPYPATYIINQEGIIEQHFISTYLNERQNPQEIIDYLVKMS